ncbi:MAG TPA: zinc ABC transporter ATP-binding protein ZnuC [Gammaproteobacteria bacterium]|nr:zinc ABC transporter ATP-binding protein ZnuC [Gammaproteobacteria bacterium]
MAEPATNPLISASKLCLHLAGRAVLDNVDVQVRAGEIVTLVGPNGSGKTSLIRVLLGLQAADSGSIQRQPGLKVGYMPQRLHVDRVLPLTVQRFLLLAGNVTDDALLRACQRSGIEPLLQKPLQAVSGGEFQRVLLARALLRKPDLLVLDEPAQGVDINGQQQLYKLIAEIRTELGCGVLMVSHDLHLVMAATDHVLCLNTHICCTGHPSAVSRHPEYLKLFGGSLEGLAVYTHHHDHTHDLHGDVVQEEHHHCGHDHDHG